MNIRCSTEEYRKEAKALRRDLGNLDVEQSQARIQRLGAMYMGITDDQDRFEISSNAQILQQLSSDVHNHQQKMISL